MRERNIKNDRLSAQHARCLPLLFPGRSPYQYDHQFFIRRDFSYLPPPAQRKALLAAELVRQKRFLNDLVALTDKPDDSSDEPGRLRYLIDEHQQIVSYLEAFSACQGSLKKCDEQARASARKQ